MSTVILSFDQTTQVVSGSTLIAPTFRFTVKDSAGTIVETQDIAFVAPVDPTLPLAPLVATFVMTTPGSFTGFGQLVDASGALVGNEASAAFTIPAVITGFPEPAIITATVS